MACFVKKNWTIKLKSYQNENLEKIYHILLLTCIFLIKCYWSCYNLLLSIDTLLVSSEIISTIFKMYEIRHQHCKFCDWIKISKRFINEYQGHCDVIQKLIHAEKWVLVTVRINLARNWKRALFRLTTDKNL